MLGITFSAEAEPSAAERISDCFQYFESRMDVIRLARYCKVLDSIKIILFTAPDEKERKHISLKWREAEIRVRLDGDTFMKASQDEQRDMVRAAITRALEIIRDRSEVKNFRFECKSLLYDMFPDAYMTPFVFSTESESPAAQMIRDNFCLIEKNMRVTSLAKYTDALDRHHSRMSIRRIFTHIRLRQRPQIYQLEASLCGYSAACPVPAFCAGTEGRTDGAVQADYPRFAGSCCGAVSGEETAV